MSSNFVVYGGDIILLLCLKIAWFSVGVEKLGVLMNSRKRILCVCFLEFLIATRMRFFPP